MSDTLCLPDVVALDERVREFRRDCIDSLVGNTCDNVHDTGNSLTGVSIPETAAYYLVRASYEPEDVADELTETADRYYAEDYGFSEEEFKAASVWGEDDVKVTVVDALRSMTLAPRVRDVLLACSDIIEGLVEPGLCTREDDCDCGGCNFEVTLDAIGEVLN